MTKRPQQGVALAIVVWFLAAMSLLVAGIVSQARVDTHIVQSHIARAKAVAAGDGAIALMLATLRSRELRSFRDRGRGVPTKEFEIGELQVKVYLIPTPGLIDLNGASKDLLALLFSSSDEIEKAQAQLLADNVVKWRNKPLKGTRGTEKFQSIEDLLAVDGIGRSLLESVRDSVVVGRQKRDGVDWQSAPESVLRVLATDGEAALPAILKAREAGSASSTALPRGLSSQFLSADKGRDYRLDAYVTVGDKTWLRRRWVKMGADESGLLPWRFTRTEAARALIETKSL